jgi:putative PIN family toxin of toxin-antitoxin system
MVLLQAAVSGRGPAAACLDEVENRTAELVVSDPVLAELADVLTRPTLRRRYRTLTDEFAADFVARVRRVAASVAGVPETVILARDPKDSMYLNLAIAAGAELVVSRDNDLLDLMTGTDPDAEAFRAAYPGIAILDPASFLRTVRPPPPADRTDEV